MSYRFLRTNGRLLFFPLPTVRPYLTRVVQYQLTDFTQIDAYRPPSQRRKL